MKKLRPHPLVFATLSTILVAIACAVVLLWEGVAPPSNAAEHPANPHRSAAVSTRYVADSPKNGGVHRIHYPAQHADPQQNYADLYLPTDYSRRTAVPVVALVHGGSWASGVGAHSFDRLARDLTARGVAVYNVEYRRVGSGGGWPTTFTDVGSALDALPAVAADYPRLALSRSVLVGHSAGAQLAAWAGLRTTADPGPGRSGPRWTPPRIISVSGPLDMAWSATHGDTRVVRVLGGSPATVPARYRSVDPIELLSRRDRTVRPEFIVVHGTADHTVSDLDSIRFAADFTAHGGRARLELLPGQSHTSMFRAHSAAYRALVDTIVDAATVGRVQ